MTPVISTGCPAKKLAASVPGVVTMIEPAAGCQFASRRNAVTWTCATERSVCWSSRSVMRQCGVSIKVPRTVTMALVSPSNARKSLGETMAVRLARFVQPTSAMSGQINHGTKFFEDEDENENDKGDAKKRDERRLKNSGEQQADGVTGNDGDERTFHGRFLPVFSPAANNPKREQTCRATGGVNEHVRHLRRARRHEDLVEFIAGGVKKDDQRARGRLPPDPGTWIIFHWSAHRAPEQQREHGVFGQMSRICGSRDEFLPPALPAFAETASAKTVRRRVRNVRRNANRPTLKKSAPSKSTPAASI